MKTDRDKIEESSMDEEERIFNMEERLQSQAQERYDEAVEYLTGKIVRQELKSKDGQNAIHKALQIAAGIKTN